MLYTRNNVILNSTVIEKLKIITKSISAETACSETWSIDSHMLKPQVKYGAFLCWISVNLCINGSPTKETHTRESKTTLLHNFTKVAFKIWQNRTLDFGYEYIGIES